MFLMYILYAHMWGVAVSKHCQFCNQICQYFTYIALIFNLSTVGISSEHVVNSFANLFNLPVFRRKSDEFSSVVQGYGSNKRYIIG